MALLSPEAVAQVKRLSVPRLAYTKSEAASALGISVDSFERYVQPHLRIVRQGKLRIIPTRELERWLEEHASQPVDA
jgi:excisionase family DNA binding protein